MNCPGAIIPGNVLSDPACALQAIFKVASLTLNWGILLAAILALFFLIMGGFKWILAGSDPKQLEQARKTLFWAIAGLVIVASAFVIMQIFSSAVPGNLPGFPPPGSFTTPLPACQQAGDSCKITNPCCAGLSCVSGFCQ